MKFINLLAIILFLPLCIMAQGENNPAAFKEMIETEQAFSKMAEVKTTREAFMAFIADDGLLFRPGAVNGKKWMNEHPVPAAPDGKKPLLSWQPSFGGMATAGDLGFSTGPWEFKSDINDATPAGYGHFVTVWKRQPDNTWKFVIDLGVSHPTSGGPQTIWKVEVGKDIHPIVKSGNLAKETELLLSRDREFSHLSLKQNLVNAFRSYSTEGVRLYLPENLPYVGREASLKALELVKGRMTWTPIAGEVSRSGDLGYTHGTYEKKSPDDSAKVVERGSYVHIWEMKGGEWKVVLSVTNAHP